MAQKTSLENFGRVLQALAAQLGQEIRSREQMNQVEALRQQFTSPVEVGAFEARPPSERTNFGGVRSVAPEPEESVLTQPPPFPVKNQLDEAGFMRGLIPLVGADNSVAVRQLQTMMALQPKYQFINQEGGGLQQATIPAFGEPSVKQIAPSIYRTPNDRKIGERVGTDGLKYATMQRPEGGTYEVEIGEQRESPGFGISQTNQLEKLRNEFNDLDREATDLQRGIYRGQVVKSLFPEGTSDAEISRWADLQRNISLKEMETKANQIESLEGILGVTPSGVRTRIRTNVQPKPSGKIRVRRKSDGQTGTIDAADFDASKYERIK